MTKGSIIENKEIIEKIRRFDIQYRNKILYLFGKYKEYAEELCNSSPFLLLYASECNKNLKFIINLMESKTEINKILDELNLLQSIKKLSPELASLVYMYNGATDSIKLVDVINNYKIDQILNAETALYSAPELDYYEIPENIRSWIYEVIPQIKGINPGEKFFIISKILKYIRKNHNEFLKYIENNTDLSKLLNEIENFETYNNL